MKGIRIEDIMKNEIPFRWFSLLSTYATYPTTQSIPANIHAKAPGSDSVDVLT